MYKTKNVKLKKSDLIFDKEDLVKNLYEQIDDIYKTPKSYVPQKILDELESSKSKIEELNEEIKELKKDIELLRSLNEEC